MTKIEKKNPHLNNLTDEKKNTTHLKKTKERKTHRKTYRQTERHTDRPKEQTDKRKTRPSGQRCVLKHFWAYPLTKMREI